MKKTAVMLITASVLLCLVGCGGGAEGTLGEATPMMMEAGQAMAGVTSYRMSGNMLVEAAGMNQAGAAVPMEMNIEAEMELSNGEIRQYMATTMNGYTIETYVIGEEVYANYPGQGWVKMPASYYKTQDLGTGMLGPENMELMAEMASEAEVVEETGDRVGLAFHLDEEYLEMGLEMTEEYMEGAKDVMPDDWMKQARETTAGFEADIMVWLIKDSKLLDSMEGEYFMQGTEATGEITGTMQFKIYDYNADIDIELPQEAEGAVEVTFPSS
jgi:hypothetical protein